LIFLNEKAYGGHRVIDMDGCYSNITQESVRAFLQCRFL